VESEFSAYLWCDAAARPWPHDFHCDKGRLLDQDAKPLQIRFICRRTARSLSKSYRRLNRFGADRSEAIGTKEQQTVFQSLWQMTTAPPHNRSQN